MNVRAGIIVTGTEVLSGRITDRNGPWVAGKLLDLGVDVAHLTVCGDRPEDLTAQLRFLADQHVSLIVTTGGLGPTADDLTVATVAAFCDRELAVDAELETHIAEIVSGLHQRSGRTHSPTATHAGVRKQSLVPAGAQPIPPTGTAPGMAIPAAKVPAILILPGPPPELQKMWPTAIASAPVVEALAGRMEFRQETIRAYGLSEADLAATLRAAEPRIAGLDQLEVTTCLRRGEVEIVTRFPVEAADTYAQLADLIVDSHAGQVFSTDGSTIDELVAAVLTGRRVATAESCTGGQIAARLTDRPGSSDYVAGGVVAYANEAKSELLDVRAELIAEYGAVSEPVAAAMAEGALTRFGVEVAVSTTGVAGPGGGSAEKPVGTVCFGFAVVGRPTVTHTRRFAGDRAMVRESSTTAALHLLAGLSPARQE